MLRVTKALTNGETNDPDSRAYADWQPVRIRYKAADENLNENRSTFGDQPKGWTMRGCEAFLSGADVLHPKQRLHLLHNLWRICAATGERGTSLAARLKGEMCR
jgi:hypothetical protein